MEKIKEKEEEEKKKNRFEADQEMMMRWGQRGNISCYGELLDGYLQMSIPPNIMDFKNYIWVKKDYTHVDPSNIFLGGIKYMASCLAPKDSGIFLSGGAEKHTGSPMSNSWYCSDRNS